MKHRPLMERIWEKILFGAPDDCWLWMAGTTAQGYGLVGLNQRAVLAHRHVYMAEFGEIPEGHVVMHTCDNPMCCNPAHLVTGTVLDNNNDRHVKGRSRGASHKGSAHPHALLNELTAGAIYYATGKQKDIADRYGVTFQTVSDIKRRKIWKHIHAS